MAEEEKEESARVSENEDKGSETAIIPTNEPVIRDLIYTVRGSQVMLDSDLAMLYQVGTKRISEAVRRNKARFPEEFCFRLTNNEYDF